MSNNNISRVFAIRVGNKAAEILDRFAKEEGYETTGTYLRDLLQNFATSERMPGQILSRHAMAELKRRAAWRNYPSVDSYLRALLESFLLGSEQLKDNEAAPKKSLPRKP